MMTFLFLGRASNLLGAFLAGLSFCTIPSLHHHTWKTQIKRLQTWTVRIFFACSVGFEVPIGNFWTAKTWSRSALFCVALIGKFYSGLLATPRNPLNVATVRPAPRSLAAPPHHPPPILDTSIHPPTHLPPVHLLRRRTAAATQEQQLQKHAPTPAPRPRSSLQSLPPPILTPPSALPTPTAGGPVDVRPGRARLRRRGLRPAAGPLRPGRLCDRLPHRADQPHRLPVAPADRPREAGGPRPEGGGERQGGDEARVRRAPPPPAPLPLTPVFSLTSLPRAHPAQGHLLQVGHPLPLPHGPHGRHPAHAGGGAVRRHGHAHRQPAGPVRLRGAGDGWAQSGPGSLPAWRRALLRVRAQLRGGRTHFFLVSFRVFSPRPRRCS